MKRLSFTIVLALTLIMTIAQVKVQKGYVRSRSFVSQRSYNLEGVKIQAYNTTYSGKDGRFALNLSMSENDQTYNIKTITLKGYQLIDPDVIRRKHQYTPHSDLVIIMYNVKELEDYQKKTEKNIKKRLQKQYNDRIKQLELQCRDVDQLKEQKAQLQAKIEKYEQMGQDYVYNTLVYNDFELQDSLTQAVYAAMENGDFQLADSLNNLRGTMETRYDNCLKLQAEANNMQKAASDSIHILIENLSQQILIDIVHRSDPETAYSHLCMRNNLAPKHIDFILETGRFLEIFHSDYHQALQLYENAIDLSLEQDGANQMTMKLARCLYRKGDVLGSLGRYNESLSCLNQALHIVESFNDKEHKLLYDILLSLGQVKAYLGQHHEAEKLFNRCITKDNTSNHTARARATIGLSGIHMMRGQYAKGKQLLEGLKGESNDLVGDGLILKAEIYNAIIQCLKEEGAINEANDSINSFINYVKKLGGEHHSSLIPFYHSSAIIRAHLGDLESAERLINQASSIVSQTIGEKNITFCQSLSLLANFHQAFGNLQKAYELAQRALNTTADLYGPMNWLTIPARKALMVYYKNDANSASAKAQLDTIRDIYMQIGFVNELLLTELEHDKALLNENLSKAEQDKIIQIDERLIQLYQEQYGSNCPRLVELYGELGYFRLNQADTHGAMEAYVQKRKICEKVFGKESSASYSCNIQEGLALIQLYKFDEASKLLDAAEKWGEKHYGKDTYSMIELYNTKGDYYMQSFDFEQALAYYHRALKIIEKTFSSSHYNNHIDLSKLGDCYNNAFQYDSALVYAKKTIDIFSHYHGQKSPILVAPISNLATIYHKKHDHHHCDSLLNIVKEIMTSFPERTEFARLNVLQLSAQRCVDKGDYLQAEQLVDEMLTIIKTRFYGNQVALANSYYLLSGIHRQAEQLAQAEKEIQLHLELNKHAYGPFSVQIVTALNNCSDYYISIKDAAKAKLYNDSAALIMEKYYDNNHIYNLRIKKGQAQILMLEQKWNLALESYKSLLQQTRNIFGPGSCEEADILAQMPMLYINLTMPDSAIAYLNQSMAIIEHSFGPETQYAINNLISIGNLYTNSIPNHRSDAFVNLNKARNICRKLYGINSYQYHQIECYMDWYECCSSANVANWITNANKLDKHLQQYYQSVCHFAYDSTMSINVMDASLMISELYFYLSMQNSAEVYLPKSIDFAQIALQINQNIFGKDHVTSAQPLQRIAMAKSNLMILKQISNTEAPDSYKEEIKSLFERQIQVFAKNNVSTPYEPDQRSFDCRWQYAQFLFNTLGDTIQALEHINSLLDDLQIIKELSPMQNNLLQQCKLAKAAFLIETGQDLITAEKILIDWTSHIDNEHSPSIEGINAKFFLGLCKQKQGDHNEALRYYNEAKQLTHVITNLTLRNQMLNKITNAIDGISIMQ